MSARESITEFRVRYAETDQMGTYYYGHVLAWFECGRSELLRVLGTPYSEMEKRGVYLPVVEAHVQYLGRAHYDDLLQMTTRGCMAGKARIRCDVRIVHADGGAPVAEGYTIHAIVDRTGRPVRPPQWLIEAFAAAPEG